MTVYDIIKELGVTKGYCSICGECDIELETRNQIKLCLNKFLSITLDENGKYLENGECVIFPSKDNRDWNMVLDENKNKLLPVFTPVMASDDGENWSVKYYMDGQFCSISKTSIYGYFYRYIVPVSKFDFDADDLFINIKKSI